MGRHISFIHTDLYVLHPHFPCHMGHPQQPEKFFKISICKIIRNQFFWKVLVNEQPPVIHDVIFYLIRILFYNFFTVVSFESPSMFRSFSPRLIASAGYSSMAAFSSSRCSSQILSSTNVFSAFVPDTPDVFT